MKYSLFSVSYAGLWGQQQLSLFDFVTKAKALGYDGVEIMCKRPHLYPHDVGDDEAAALARHVEDAGLEVACMAAYTNFCAGAESREVPLLDLQVSYVRAICRLAARLECGLVRIFTGYENGREPFARQWEMCVRGIRACCDAAAEFGVTVGVQNHHDIGVDTDALLELAREVDRPNLGLMADAWSMFLRGEDVAASLRKVGEKMAFSTVADYVVLPRHRYRPDLVNYEPVQPAFVKAVPMGEGTLDYGRYFTALREIGYDGWVSYETCSPLRDGGSVETIDEYGAAFLRYMATVPPAP